MRILIAEDSGPSRLLLERILADWGYQVVSCKDGACAWQELQKENAPRLAILDWMMPGYSGLEICRMLRQKSPEAYTYILLLTSKSQKEDLVEGMEAGADDYLTKPFDQHELRARLRAGIRILNLQAELLAAREEIRQQAMRDSLTGLWNRRSILEVLTRELVRGFRERTPVAALMMDLDHFKQINDTYGHLAGDAVLQEASRRLLNSVRTYDGVGRYGGEEFLIVLPGCDETSILHRAEAMRLAICESPVVAGDVTIPVTASFGAAVCPVNCQLESLALIALADEALYEAKRNGRNRVSFRGFSPAYSLPTGTSPTYSGATDVALSPANEPD
ncbi:MAG: diguanylate cyclase [Bryobacteraceae bacterium]|nr:diguanylate cyclase [Bryobacteraceae bacterium]MDW8376885.1 diguanylate cyclase [Bryobacterales bacterium]